MGAKHALFTVFLHRKKIRIDLPFGDLHPVLFIQRLHRFIIITDGGNQPQVVQFIFFQIVFSGSQHVRRRHRQSHIQPNTQRHNGKNRHVTPQALPNLPQCCFHYGRFHDISNPGLTTRSLLPE